MMAKVFYSTGRRKTSSSRVFLSAGKGQITVNNLALDKYFPCQQQRNTLKAPLKLTETEKELDVKITVKGGGLTGQCEAIRHGLSRALVLYSDSYRGLLKRNGFLTRDSRSVERKKYGRHKARKSTQYSKR